MRLFVCVWLAVQVFGVYYGFASGIEFGTPEFGRLAVESAAQGLLISAISVLVVGLAASRGEWW